MACSNTNIRCTSCNTNNSGCNTNCSNCGCKDGFLRTPAPCPSPAGCPDPPACSEVLDSNCVIYSGPGIVCNGDTVVVPDTSVMEAMDDIVQYFCSFNPLIPEMTCDLDIVIEADSSIIEAFQAVVDYFCAAVAGLTSITADNGLTMSTSTNVQWGGTLLQDTTIAQGAYTTSFTATPTAGTSVMNIITNGTDINTIALTIRNLVTDATSQAAQFNGYDGTGLVVSTSNAPTNPAISATADDGVAGNIISTVLRLYGSTSATPLAGTGAAIDFNYTTAALSRISAGKIGYESTTNLVLPGLNAAKFFITTKTSGVATADTKLEISGPGQLRLNKYGIGTFTGTPTFNLLTSATGQVIEQTAGLFGTAFRATISPPPTINSSPIDFANSFIGFGQTIIPIVQYQLVNGVTTTQYNAGTGVWTCPQTGRYDINYNVYFTAPTAAFGWGSVLADGNIHIGVTDTTGTAIIYFADIIFIRKGVYLQKAYATGALQGVSLNAGTQLILKVLNFTGINYVPVVGDNIDWSIRRVG